MSDAGESARAKAAGNEKNCLFVSSLCQSNFYTDQIFLFHYPFNFQAVSAEEAAAAAAERKREEEALIEKALVSVVEELPSYSKDDRDVIVKRHEDR